MSAVHHFKVKRSRSHWSFDVFIVSAPWLPPYLTESLHMWHTYTTHEGVMCRAPFSGWKVNGQGHMGRFKFWSCLLCGFIPIWLNHFICGIHATHEGLCVAHHFQDERSRSHRSFLVLALSALWLHPYLAEALHMWHTYTTSGNDVSYIIFRFKDQGHTGCLKFLPCPLRGFFLIHQITSYVAYIEHIKGRCVAHHFLSFVSFVSVAPSLSDWPLAAEGSHSC